MIEAESGPAVVVNAQLTFFPPHPVPEPVSIRVEKEPSAKAQRSVP